MRVLWITFGWLIVARCTSLVRSSSSENFDTKNKLRASSRRRLGDRYQPDKADLGCDGVQQSKNETAGASAGPCQDPNLQLHKRDTVVASVSVAIPSSLGENALNRLEGNVRDATTLLFNSNLNEVLNCFENLSDDTFAMVRNYTMSSFFEILQNYLRVYREFLPVIHQYIDGTFDPNTADLNNMAMEDFTQFMASEAIEEDFESMIDFVWEDWQTWLLMLDQSLESLGAFLEQQVDTWNGDDWNDYVAEFSEWLNATSGGYDVERLDVNTTNGTISILYGNNSMNPLVDIVFEDISRMLVPVRSHPKYDFSSWQWWDFTIRYKIYVISPHGQRVLVDDNNVLEYVDVLLNEFMRFSVITGMLAQTLKGQIEKNPSNLAILGVAMGGTEGEIMLSILNATSQNSQVTASPSEVPVLPPSNGFRPGNDPTQRGTYSAELDPSEYTLQFYVGLSLFVGGSTFALFLSLLAVFLPTRNTSQTRRSIVWASNQDLEGMLKIGWKQGVNKILVIDKGLHGYEDNDSMLIGGCEHVHNLSMEISTEVLSGGPTASPSVSLPSENFSGSPNSSFSDSTKGPMWSPVVNSLPPQ